jgi:CDP-6-deoxy-D-xylo-4-hexulose-3-dehydrase
MQAAVGLAQLQRVDGFIARRRENFEFLRQGFLGLQDFFILPEATPNSEPSWFGFPLALRSGAPFTRNQVVQFLESRKIATRLLFGGNLARQPAYRNAPFRVAGTLPNSDVVMNDVFWIGVYPGLTRPMLEYVVEVFHELVSTR